MRFAPRSYDLLAVDQQRLGVILSSNVRCAETHEVFVQQAHKALYSVPRFPKFTRVTVEDILQVCADK